MARYPARPPERLWAGRDELERLESELDQVRLGASAAASSRLSGSRRWQVQARGGAAPTAWRAVRVARGACLSYGEGITYWPIAQVLRDLAGIRDEHTLDEVRLRFRPGSSSCSGSPKGR